jgi:hypothetical protein
MLVTHALAPGQQHFGGSTWVNMRPFMPSNAIGNLISRVLFVLDELPESTTVGEFKRSTRKKFSEKDRGEILSESDKDNGIGTKGHEAGTRVLRRIECRIFRDVGPIVDAFGQLTVPGSASMGLLGLTIRYPYSQFVFTRTDAVRALKAFVYSLQKIRPDTKVVDAIRELQQVTA